MIFLCRDRIKGKYRYDVALARQCAGLDRAAWSYWWLSVFYGPLGQFGKPKPARGGAAGGPAAPAAPAVRGPVIREVPN